MTCKKCKGNGEPYDEQKALDRAGDEIARAIDLEVLAQVGAWMDGDKGYALGTREKYEEFVKQRNYSFGEDK